MAGQDESSPAEAQAPTPPSAPSRAVVSARPGVAPPADPAPQSSLPDGGDEAILADESSILDDTRTDRAVTEIIAQESDELLAAQDAAREGPVPVRARRRGFWRGLGHLFYLWLGTPAGRWLTFGVLVAGTAAVAVMPQARYWTLNTARVRASATVTVVDEITQLPLQGVPVSLAGRTTPTNAHGTAQFAQLRLGTTQLAIRRPGFAAVSRQVVIGWGSNPFGTVSLDATGLRYTITATDYLSGKPLSGVLATAGEATAQSDDNGKIELTVADTTATAANGLGVSLSKDGYRTTLVSVKQTGQSTPAQLVPARKTVFVSRASGTYDLYKSDIDGSNREILLHGTGAENANMSVALSPDGAYAAVVSTRDNKPDADGFLLSTLTLVKVDGGTTVTLAHAAQLQLIDWSGTRLVFEQVSSDPTVPASARNSIISYDYQTNSRLQLAAVPTLNGVFSAQGSIYYIVANDSNNTGSQKPGLYDISPDGGNRHTAYDHEVWAAVRTDYDTLALQTADGWVNYNLQSGAVNAVAAPASYVSRLYRDNDDHTQSLWANQDMLVLFDTQPGKDTTLQTQPGLSYPLQWLGSAAVYRVVSGSETADYITALVPGATPHKIADVANTYGFSTGQ